MRAWRIVLRKFGRNRQAAFSGLSGFSADGRWHSSGRHLDYDAQSPALWVRSAITPGEHNLMVNSHHPGWKWDWITSGPEPFAFDTRLADMMKPGR